MKNNLDHERIPCDERAALPRVNGEVPDVLFDGYAVYHVLSPRARLRTSPENVSDVLDAVVYLLRKQAAQQKENNEKR